MCTGAYVYLYVYVFMSVVVCIYTYGYILVCLIIRLIHSHGVFFFFAPIVFTFFVSLRFMLSQLLLMLFISARTLFQLQLLYFNF